MKNFRRITALLIAMLAISLFAFAFVACKVTPDDSADHTCEYETEWSFDDTRHWHKCKDSDCDKVSDEAAHDWNEGEVTMPATKDEKGVKTYTCKDCGKTKTEDVEYVHECEYETEWSFDDTRHWHKCKDSDCTEISVKAEHDWNDGEITTAATVYAKGVKTFTCKVCGKTKTEDMSKLTDKGDYFSALEGSYSKMQNSDSIYVISTMSETYGSDTGTNVTHITWNSEGKGAQKYVHPDYTTYKLVNVAGDKYYLTEIEKGDTCYITNKEYVSSDYWTKENFNGLAEISEDIVLSENEFKTMLFNSLKSMAGSFGLVDSEGNKITSKDISDENIIYVCTVSTENGVAKIVASVSLKTEWLATVTASGMPVSQISMQVVYAFTADKMDKLESEIGVILVAEGQEMPITMYSSYEFDTNFNQTLFEESIAVEEECDAYEDTVEGHSTQIKVLINGEEFDYYYVSYDDKAAAKTRIDEFIADIKNNLKESEEDEDTVDVKAYLDKECTIEYTEANKDDLVIDCVDGGKIYLKVTPIDENKTVVFYVYKVYQTEYDYTYTYYREIVVADRASDYRIITAPYGEYGDVFSDKRTVVTEITIDLTGKETVVIVCTRNHTEQ